MSIEEKRLPITVSILYRLQVKMEKLAEENNNSVSYEYNEAIKNYVKNNN